MRLRNIPRAKGVLEEHGNVIKEEKRLKGSWQQEFGNDHPIHIEIGMGKGQFLLSLAKRNPDINYIGIERYSSVILRAVERYDEEIKETETKDFLSNIRFICMDATEIEEVFAPEEVDKIYLNFSDPWPKERHARRRLPSREFLGRYNQILAADGTVEFKTDNRGLFDFALEEVEPAGWHLDMHTFDLHAQEELMKDNVMTEYEEKFSSIGNPICKYIISR